jgi:hypothetical protein
MVMECHYDEPVKAKLIHESAVEKVDSEVILAPEVLVIY